MAMHQSGALPGGHGFATLAGIPFWEPNMIKQKLFDDFAARVSEVIAASPARDLEKNLKATLSGMLAKLDVVTREEFDVQAQVLARTREKLQELEVRMAKLEGAPVPEPADIVQHGDAGHLEP